MLKKPGIYDDCSTNRDYIYINDAIDAIDAIDATLAVLQSKTKEMIFNIEPLEADLSHPH